MAKQLSSNQIRRRKRKAKQAELIKLGREAKALVESAKAKAESAAAAADDAQADKAELLERLNGAREVCKGLEDKVGDLIASNHGLDGLLTKRNATIDDLRQTLEQSTIHARQLEGAMAELRTQLERANTDTDRKAKIKATQMVREMHPEWRKRMLDKNNEIARLRIVAQMERSMRNPEKEESVLKAIKQRDQIIVGIYSGLVWCEQRQEFQSGEGKVAWDAKLGTLMTKLRAMIEVKETPEVAQAPMERAAEQAPPVATQSETAG